MLQQNDNIANPSVITLLEPDECNSLVLFLENENWESTLVGAGVSNSMIRRNFSLRVTDANWWVKNLAPVVVEALTEVNRTYWGFDVTGQVEATVLRYREGDHYNTWHSDVGVGACSNRKISFSIQLSEPESYVGGDLVFDTSREKDHREVLRGQGRMVVFPSFLSHKVIPVSSGVRYCIVGWLKGPPFR